MGKRWYKGHTTQLTHAVDSFERSPTCHGPEENALSFPQVNERGLSTSCFSSQLLISLVLSFQGSNDSASDSSKETKDKGTAPPQVIRDFREQVRHSCWLQRLDVK